MDMKIKVEGGKSVGGWWCWSCSFFSFNTFESVYWLFLLLTKLVLFLIKKIMRTAVWP